MNRAALSKRLDAVAALVAEDIAQRGPDPQADLTARQRAAVKQYQCTTDPLMQWIDYLNGENPAVQFMDTSLPKSITDQQAQDRYQKMLDWHPVIRRRLK